MTTNELIINRKKYKLESVWRTNKSDHSKDIKGKLFPYPKIGHKWTGIDQFLFRLDEIETYLEQKGNRSIALQNCKDCLICKQKCVTTKQYKLDDTIWENGLSHYIKRHFIKPSNEFIEKIFNYEIKKDDLPIKLHGRIRTGDNIVFLKIERNQIMILDALMKHGGYTKKYVDVENKNVFRYSEHAGVLDIKNKLIDKIIVSGNTLRVDRGDEEIFLPIDFSDVFEYEYIFHSHPPERRMGGRVKHGILYEFPSLGDLFHFIDHHNDGKTIGSLVITPEGLYNIRKLVLDKKRIKINEDIFFDEVQKTYRDVQIDAIQKYGYNFSTYTFYSKISQDLTYINRINEILKKYQLLIEFYPRTRDSRGNWIVDTIYMPLFKI